MTAAELNVKIGADTKGAEEGMARVGEHVSNMGKAIAVGAGAGVLALGGLAVAGIKMAGDLQQSVANISTIKPDIDTSAVFNSLNEMSTRIPQSASELGDAMYNIFSSMDVNTEGATKLLETFAKGAVGAQTDAQTFGTSIMGVMNAYGLSVEDAAHVSDVFFNTVNAGVVSGQELAASLGPVTQSAKSAGVSIDELGALIAGVTKEGGPAAQNMNNLNNFFMKVTTKEAQAQLRGLGVAVTDNTGHFRPMMEVMGDLKTKTDGMTDAAKSLAIQGIFPDAQARQAATTILDQMGFINQAIDDNKTKVGVADEAYKKMSNTFNGQLKLAINGVKSVLTQLGAAILPIITPLIKGFAEQLPGAINAFKAALSGGSWGANLTPLQTAFALLGKVVQAVRDGVLTFIKALQGNWADSSQITAFHRALGIIGTVIHDQIIPAIQAVIGYVRDLKAAFDAGGWSAVLSKVMGSLGDWGAKLLSWLGDMAVQAGAKLLELGGKFWEWIQPQIAPMLAKLAELGGRLLSWVGEQIGPLLSKLLELGGKFVEWVGPQIPPLLGKLAELGGQLLSWVGDQIPKIVEKLKEWGRKFLDWIEKDVLPDLPTNLLHIAEKVLTFIAETAIKVVPELVKLAAKFFEWIVTDAIPGIVRELPGITVKIIGWIGEAAIGLATEAVKIGAAIIKGMVSGVVNAAGDLVSAVGSAVGGALGHAKGMLGIRSPSAVYANEVGKPMVQGIMAGIISTMPALFSVQDQMLQIARAHAIEIGKAAVPVLPGMSGKAPDQKAVDGMMRQFNALFNPPKGASDQKAVGGMMAVFNSMFNPTKAAPDQRAVDGIMAQFNGLYNTPSSAGSRNSGGQTVILNVGGSVVTDKQIIDMVHQGLQALSRQGNLQI